eukprot:3644767-Pyramimonas_sp.AAC.1
MNRSAEVISSRLSSSPKWSLAGSATIHRGTSTPGCTAGRGKPSTFAKLRPSRRRLARSASERAPNA